MSRWANNMRNFYSNKMEWSVHTTVSTLKGYVVLLKSYTSQNIVNIISETCI